MKRLKIGLQKMRNAEVLTREQLRKVLGGAETVMATPPCDCNTNADCINGKICVNGCDGANNPPHAKHGLCELQ